MIIIDNALLKRHQENNPIRVGMMGAGFMAQGIANQICNYVKGMELVAIFNRTTSRAISVYNYAGIVDVGVTDSRSQLEDNISRGKYTVVENPEILCEAAGIDVIVDVTGSVEFSAHAVLRAIRNKKHVVLMNAELDGTIGSILKYYADKEGVIITNADGDQPGVEMNLFRFVNGLGVKPVLCGNIKGLHDPYRNPTTQEGFARQWGQNPTMVTSFADGTKISFEQAIVANATGMRVGKTGMYGPTVPSGSALKDVVNDLYPLDDLLAGPGIVDYVVGAEPGPGVFVIGTHDDPKQQHYLNLYKLGKGPLYLFYTPYHLCHFEVPNTIARAVLFGDAALAPLGRPKVDVIASAKKDMNQGEKIDCLGGYMTYGLCENYDVSLRNDYLPIGLAEGCVLKNDIKKDAIITYDDVILPENRLVDKLKSEQIKLFAEESDMMPNDNDSIKIM